MTRYPIMHSPTPLIKSALNPGAVEALKWLGSAAVSAPVTYGEYTGYNPLVPGSSPDSRPPVRDLVLPWLANTAAFRYVPGAVAKGKKNPALAGAGILGAMLSTPAIEGLKWGGDVLPGVLQERAQRARESLSGGRMRTLLGAGLGLGALGLGAVGVSEARKARKQLEKPKDQRDMGRVRITLPTKDPHDNETVVELPLDHAKLTQTAINQMRRDIRRRLRDEGQERTIPREKVAMYADHIEILNWLDKRAFFGRGGSDKYAPPADMMSATSDIGKPVQMPDTLQGTPTVSNPGQQYNRNLQTQVNNAAIDPTASTTTPGQAQAQNVGQQVRAQGAQHLAQDRDRFMSGIQGYQQAWAQDMPGQPVQYTDTQRDSLRDINTRAQTLGQDPVTRQSFGQPAFNTQAQSPAPPGHTPVTQQAGQGTGYAANTHQGQYYNNLPGAGASQLTAQGQPYQQVGDPNVLRGPQGQNPGMSGEQIAAIQAGDPEQTVLGPGQADWTRDQVAQQFKGWDEQRLRSVGMNAQADMLFPKTETPAGGGAETPDTSEESGAPAGAPTSSGSGREPRTGPPGVASHSMPAWAHHGARLFGELPGQMGRLTQAQAGDWFGAGNSVMQTEQNRAEGVAREIEAGRRSPLTRPADAVRHNISPDMLQRTGASAPEGLQWNEHNRQWMSPQHMAEPQRVEQAGSIRRRPGGLWQGLIDRRR